MAHQGRLIKRAFRTPEGRFQIYSERQNACNFNAARPTRLTLVKLGSGTYVVFNVQDCIHICSYGHTDKVCIVLHAYLKCSFCTYYGSPQARSTDAPGTSLLNKFQPSAERAPDAADLPCA